ncbi:unnamed protein product [Amoebophrya sp. A25]|nr:unnamed protein product [Amoebophrya sp. A25]|eukprot:GSA25T00014156001.1
MKATGSKINNMWSPKAARNFREPAVSAVDFFQRSPAHRQLVARSVDFGELPSSGDSADAGFGGRHASSTGFNPRSPVHQGSAKKTFGNNQQGLASPSTSSPKRSSSLKPMRQTVDTTLRKLHVHTACVNFLENQFHCDFPRAKNHIRSECMNIRGRMDQMILQKSRPVPPLIEIPASGISRTASLPSFVQPHSRSRRFSQR